MHEVISSYPSYETVLSPRLILGLWHPLFIAPANRCLPSLAKFHIGFSTHLARKYFWDLDGFSIAMPMLTSEDGQRFLRDCKAAGKGIMTWTVNEAKDMRVAKSWGIEWLITDRVGFAVEARKEVSRSVDRGEVDGGYVG
jgi:glycerophosphoryl diester phosphodiesterase